MSSNLEQLTAAKLAKLVEQKALSDKMSAMLHDRMIPSQTQNNKNLSAAISVSKKPGFFEYYQAPDDVKEFERDKALNKLVRQLGKLHSEIVSISEEIDLAMQDRKKNIDASRTKALDASGGNMSTLSQWLESHGAPTSTMEVSRDQYTTFKPASKIYGGTAHHRSFKSSASSMTQGRMTR